MRPHRAAREDRERGTPCGAQFVRAEAMRRACPPSTMLASSGTCPANRAAIRLHLRHGSRAPRRTECPLPAARYASARSSAAIEPVGRDRVGSRDDQRRVARIDRGAQLAHHLGGTAPAACPADGRIASERPGPRAGIADGACSFEHADRALRVERVAPAGIGVDDEGQRHALADAGGGVGDFGQRTPGRYRAGPGFV